MAGYALNENVYSIDDRLADKLKNEVIPELKSKDFDCVFVVSGRERSGKSTFARILGGFLASQLGTEFTIGNICITHEQLHKKIKEMWEKNKDFNMKFRNTVLVLDEAHRGMSSSRALSEANLGLKDTFMEMGALGLVVIIVLPSYFMLERYFALHRARGLFHIYTHGSERGYWAYFNEKDKKNLYLKGKKNLDMDCIKWPEFRGKFSGRAPIDLEEYNKLKSISLKENEGLGKKETRFQKYFEALLYILNKKEGITQEKLGMLLFSSGIRLDRSTIGDHINNFIHENIVEE